VSELGQGLADETISMCQKVQNHSEFDQILPILEEMVKKANEGRELVRGTLESFKAVQKKLLEVASFYIILLPRVVDRVPGI
jgi:hypothetical protein